MVFDPYAFKESAAGMFTNALVRNVVLYRHIREASRTGWEADMTAAIGRQVTVLNGTTGHPAGSASAYLVSEMVVSNSTDRAMSFYPGLDILSASVPTGKPGAHTIAAILNAVTRIFSSQPAVLPPITSHVAGKNVTAITLGRGIHISQAADFSAAAPDVTFTVRANGYPTADSVAYVPPPPAQYQNRLDTTSVKLVAGMVVDAGKLFSLLVNATLGLPGVYGHYTSTGALGGKVAGVYMEDISDLPQVLNNSRLPSGASSPNMLLSNADIDVQPGDGLYVLAGLHGPAGTSTASDVLTVGGSSGGGLTLHLKQEFEREQVLALFSPARLRENSNAVVASVIIAYAFRQYLVSLVSADDYLATERPASWPYLILGFGITFIVSMMMYVCLWAAQKRRRETLKRQREEEVREKAMLVVQNDVMALLSHEIRNPAHVIASAVTFLGEVIPEGHPSRVDLDAIAQSTEALHRLVNDVIAFSAIRRGQLEIRPQLMEVRPLVRRIVQSHRQFSSVPLLCVVEGAVPRHMICDSMRLQQILTNGLTNACKFCTDGRIVLLVRLRAPLVDKPPQAAHLSPLQTFGRKRSVLSSSLDPESRLDTVHIGRSTSAASGSGEGATGLVTSSHGHGPGKRSHYLTAASPSGQAGAASLPLASFVEFFVMDTGPGPVFPALPAPPAQHQPGSQTGRRWPHWPRRWGRRRSQSADGRTLSRDADGLGGGGATGVQMVALPPVRRTASGLPAAATATGGDAASGAAGGGTGQEEPTLRPFGLLQRGAGVDDGLFPLVPAPAVPQWEGWGGGGLRGRAASAPSAVAALIAEPSRAGVVSPVSLRAAGSGLSPRTPGGTEGQLRSAGAGAYLKPQASLAPDCAGLPSHASPAGAAPAAVGAARVSFISKAFGSLRPWRRGASQSSAADSIGRDASTGTAVSPGGHGRPRSNSHQRRGRGGSVDGNSSSQPSTQGASDRHTSSPASERALSAGAGVRPGSSPPAATRAARRARASWGMAPRAGSVGSTTVPASPLGTPTADGHSTAAFPASGSGAAGGGTYSSSTAARIRGSQIGLPVADLLAEALEGRLHLYRDMDQRVTVFRAVVPLVPEGLRPHLQGYLQAQEAAAAVAANSVTVSVAGPPGASPSVTRSQRGLHTGLPRPQPAGAQPAPGTPTVTGAPTAQSAMLTPSGAALQAADGVAASAAAGPPASVSVLNAIRRSSSSGRRRVGSRPGDGHYGAGGTQGAALLTPSAEDRAALEASGLLGDAAPQLHADLFRPPPGPPTASMLFVTPTTLERQQGGGAGVDHTGHLLFHGGGSGAACVGAGPWAATPLQGSAGAAGGGFTMPPILPLPSAVDPTLRPSARVAAPASRGRHASFAEQDLSSPLGTASRSGTVLAGDSAESALVDRSASVSVLLHAAAAESAASDVSLPSPFLPPLAVQWPARAEGALAAPPAGEVTADADTTPSVPTDPIARVGDQPAVAATAAAPPPPPPRLSLRPENGIGVQAATSSAGQQSHAAAAAASAAAPAALASSRLPGHRTGGSGASGKPSTPAAAPLGLHVLVTDDERANRMIFGRFLERLGCTFVAVGEGDEATAELELTGQLPPLGAGGGAGVPALPVPLAKQPSAGDPTSQAPTPRGRRPFDVVFLDIVMCRTDGAQTCRDLRRRGLRLPVIAATGNRSCRQYFEAGFDHVMEKPFTQAVLLAVLSEHVLAPQAAAAAARAAAVPDSASAAGGSPAGLAASPASAPAAAVPGLIARDASAPAASVVARGTLAASAAGHSTSASAPEISESALGVALDDKPSSAAPPKS